MLRVLKPGGRLLVLGILQVWEPLKPAYDLYSFKALPLMGKLVANDSASYKYLAESIRMHPSQEELKQLMLDVGFDRVDYHNLTAGVVALHKAVQVLRPPAMIIDCRSPRSTTCWASNLNCRSLAAQGRSAGKTAAMLHTTSVYVIGRRPDTASSDEPDATLRIPHWRRLWLAARPGGTARNPHQGNSDFAACTGQGAATIALGCRGRPVAPGR